MNTNSIFEFDQEIMQVWATAEDLDLLLDFVCNENASQDDIANALLGIRTLLNLRCEKMYNAYSEILKEQNESRLSKPLPF